MSPPQDWLRSALTHSYYFNCVRFWYPPCNGIGLLIQLRTDVHIKQLKIQKPLCHSVGRNVKRKSHLWHGRNCPLLKVGNWGRHYFLSTLLCLTVNHSPWMLQEDILGRWICHLHKQLRPLWAGKNSQCPILIFHFIFLFKWYRNKSIFQKATCYQQWKDAIENEISASHSFLPL